MQLSRFIISAFCCLGILFSQRSSGQLPLKNQPLYKVYNAEGTDIGTNIIYNLVAGPYGYLWLATDIGLLRYNGVSFAHVPLGNAANKEMIGMYQTQNKELILLFFDGTTQSFNLTTHEVRNTDSAWGLNLVKNNGRPFLLAFEDNNELHLMKREFSTGSFNHWGNVRVIKGKAIADTNTRAVEKFVQKYTGYPSARTAKIVSDWRGKAAGSIMSVDSFVLIDRRIYNRFLQPGEPVLVFDGNIPGNELDITSCVRNGNDLWIGSLNKGLTICKDYKKKSGKLIQLTAGNVSGICKDHMGNIWVSTLGKGLLKFSTKEQDILFYPNDSLGIKENVIQYIDKSENGNILFSTNMNAHVQIWNKSGRLFSKTFPFQVRYLIQNERQICLFGRNIYVLKNYLTDRIAEKKEEGFYNLNLKDFFVSGADYYLMSTSSYFRIQDTIFKRKEFAKTQIFKTTMQITNTGNVITGTTHGVYFNEKKMNWLPDAHFLKIRIAGDKLVCCTHSGAYLVAISALPYPSTIKKLGNFIAFDVKQDDSFFYFRTKTDMLVMDCVKYAIKRKYSFREFSNPFSPTDFFVDSPYITVAGNTGIFFFPKKDLVHGASLVPQIYILNSENNNRPADSFFQCSYGSKKLFVFKLDVLDYSNDEQIISYRILKDEDIYSDWTATNIRDELRFKGLAPGKYRFEFALSNKERRWSKHLNYTLLITPLWWQIWWVKMLKWALAILLFYFLLVSIIKRQHKNTLNRIKEKLLTTELESQALTAQMKPHFIFNALIPFQDMIIREDSKGALTYVNTFSRLMRGFLKNSRQKTIALNEEMSFIRNYVAVQQHLYPGCFEMSITMGAGIIAEQMYIPTMLIQPVIENAIEHGLMSLSYPGLLEISINTAGEQLIIAVRDNGKGLGAEMKVKDNHALKIIEERILLIKKLHGVGSFSIQNSSEGKGVLVNIILPNNLN